MNNTGASLLEIILWVLLVNAILFASAYGLVQWLRKKSRDHLAEVTGHLQQFSGRTTDVQAFVQHYEVVGEEPYLSPVQKLSTQVQEIGVSLQQLEAGIQSLKSAVEEPGSNLLRAIINAPIHSYQNNRASNRLLEESAAIDTHLADAESQVQGIYDLPWQMALQVREASGQVENMVQLSQALKQKGVQGSLLNSAAARIPVLQHSLNDVSPDFYTSEKDPLLQTITLDATVQVFGVLSSVRPMINRWLPLLKDWDLHHQAASAELNGVQQAIGNLKQSLSQPPSGLEAAPIQTRLNRVSNMHKDLEKRLSKPDADELKAIRRETTRLRKLTEDANLQLNKAGQSAAELGRVLNELNTLVDGLTAQMTGVEKKDYPLIWDESGVELEGLHRSLQAIGSAAKARTPEEISATLDRGDQIRARLNGLGDKFKKVSEQYLALTTLLESPEMKESSSWLRKTREMTAQAEVYDPRSWSRPDTLVTLKTDLDKLAAEQARLVPTGQPVLVKESGILERLNQTEQMVAQYKAIRSRVETLRARLENVQALEKEAKDNLSGAWSALEKVSILAESNDLLREIATADSKRLFEEMQRLGDELNQQGQGVIERKQQAIQTETNAVFQAIQAWLARLGAENAALMKQISDRLAELDSIAFLEDPPFQEARSLLQRDEPHPAPAVSLRATLAQRAASLKPAKAPPTSSMTDQEVSAEVKRKNDLWQTLLAAHQAVEEKSAPILQAYTEAAEARREAQERVAELNTQFTQRRTWPPTNQAPLQETEGLGSVNAKWEAMRKQHVRSDWTILELGRMAGQFRSVAQHAVQLIDRIRQDQERITEQEGQIEDLKERWLLQSQSAADNALLYHGVQQLLAHTDAQLSYIRQQYMRGQLTYDEAQQSLHLLYDELNIARVPVDDSHDIGLSNQRPHQGQASKPSG